MYSLLKKAEREFRKYAKEEIEVRNISGTLYAFGPEIACLRLMVAYRRCDDKVAVGYSEVYKSWYFRLEMSFPNIESDQYSEMTS